MEMLEKVGTVLEELKNTFDSGKIIKDGIKTAIIGKPNVGKSSLLNLLLKEERAIVSQYEGTTRDTIEEFIIINGIPVKIIDTAGIRQAENEIEKIGVEKAVKIANEADLIIAVFDISTELTEEDKRILEIASMKKSIIILNKSDLEQKLDESIFKNIKNLIKMSILEQKGIKELENTITTMFKLDEIQVENSVIVTNARHKDLIKKAIQEVEEAKKSIGMKVSIDIVTIYIRNILENLNSITGENVSEDILKKIFSKFCLGK